jgi:hypothetical protein
MGNEKQYKIFCDMDGVITNFDKAYHKLTGIEIGGSHVSDSGFWDPINKAGRDFWVNMEWMSDGKKLWDVISKHNPTLLSAPSRSNESRVGKFDWVQRELPGVPLILRSASRKREFASPNHILIDDREDNIKGWIEDGGEGILHKSTEDTLKILKEKYNIQ